MTDQTTPALVQRATQNGDCAGVRAALAAAGDDLEIVSCTAALADAVQGNHVSVAAILLEHGLKLQTSHLRTAVQGRRFEMLQMFLGHGWEINRPLGKSTPPALDHGADPDAACDAGVTPLSSAVECGQLSVIRKLLDRVEDASHGYLLHRVVHRTASHRMDVVKLLLDRGAPVNQVMY
ncbi:hypothetical protein FH972_024035 [Carpinus fangiana]|uniref:Uncharacterized protein n=1 Tax=Carpinus fangiana TaxID=176857 RepID=A0A5N6KXN7_9ROSI|nr:hypothetical protein FH972_024035 [Carpinus fangiana]